MTQRKNVFTIDPLFPFAETLAQYVLETAPYPSDLSDYLILLPTRRACRTFQDTLLTLRHDAALLCPHCLPLGDLDEDDLLDSFDASLPLPPVSSTRRRLILAHLIMSKPADYGLDQPTPTQAAELAEALSHLIDQVDNEILSFDRLTDLVPAQYAQHWQDTLTFLKIVTHHLPDILASEGHMNPAAYRVRLLQAQALLWQKNPPSHPIIAAGSTGSLPATAQLLSTLASLKTGVVVLPGLDRALDDASWSVLSETHPQYGLKHLLETMDLQRSDIHDLPVSVSSSCLAPVERQILASEFMRPVDTTDQWHLLPPLPSCTLDGVTYLSCATAYEEAQAIALILRDVLETPHQTAMLITPDRQLAQRVTVALKRWDVHIDDSAGTPLSRTQAGSFLLLTAQMVLSAFAPYPLLQVLKHPFLKTSLHFTEFLELHALRGPRPAPGLLGLRACLQPFLSQDSGFSDFFDSFYTACLDLVSLFEQSSVPLDLLLKTHLACAERLAPSLWAGEESHHLLSFLHDFTSASSDFSSLTPDTYPSFLEHFLSGTLVRPTLSYQPRLTILGPMEARLQRADVVILGGLNEGTFPAETSVDPWMSRSMRHDFGLPGLERKIGLSSHDFVQAFCAPRVFLTRAQKVDGTPTLPSRWLMRLEAVMAQTGLSWPASPYLSWARLMDVPTSLDSCNPPMPCPPLEARPRQLSVTQIETWMRDPYSIYARHILHLRALDPIDAAPQPSDFGVVVHKALEEFMAGHPHSEERLMDCFNRHLISDLPLHVVAFWHGRFRQMADWFLTYEKEWRPHVQKTFTEIRGSFDVTSDFTLTATADRLDLLRDGSLALIDYKTGTLPTQREITAGYAPQLPLEGLIAQKGGFGPALKASVSHLLYWQLGTGKGSDGGACVALSDHVDTLIEEAHRNLNTLVMAFHHADTPYMARPHPYFAPQYSDYEHLARVKEWSSVGE